MLASAFRSCQEQTEWRSSCVADELRAYDVACGSAIDRGGDGNILTNAGPMSSHHVGGAFNSTLIDFEKADMDALRAQYPDGFAGKFATWNREG